MAGGVKFGYEEEMISDINITPFVDVVLVLLIIFMVTAGIMVKRGLNLELPTAQMSEKINQTEPWNIEINEYGNIKLQGNEVSLLSLQSHIQTALNSHIMPSIIIAGDKKCAYENIIQVIDLLSKLGISEYSLETNLPK